MYIKKLKTLLVDDHMLFLEGLESILESYGELDLLPPVTRGKEALEIILNTTVDFLITDLNLPDVSGVDLILKIKKEKPQIPILVLSMDCHRKEVKSILNGKCVHCEAFPIDLVLSDEQKGDDAAFMNTHLNDSNFKGEIKERFDKLIELMK